MDNEFNGGQSNKPQNGYAITSLVLGIVSIACCCSSYISLVIAALAIAFYFINKNKTGTSSGMATAGLVCGIFGLVMAIFSIIVSFTSFSQDFLNEYMTMLESMLSDIEAQQ